MQMQQEDSDATKSMYDADGRFDPYSDSSIDEDGQDRHCIERLCLGAHTSIVDLAFGIV